MESRKVRCWPINDILCINDICDVSKLFQIILFADNTSTFYSASNIDDVTNVVNDELKQLDLWFRDNRLSLNVNCVYYTV